MILLCFGLKYERACPKWTSPFDGFCVGAFIPLNHRDRGRVDDVLLSCGVLVGCLGGVVLAYDEGVWFEILINKATRPL